MEQQNYDEIARQFVKEHPELNKVESQSESANTQIAVVEDKKDITVKKEQSKGIVAEARAERMKEISDSQDFKEATDKLYKQEVKTEYESIAISIANKELQNEYDKYALSKKKELLNYKVKKERNIVKEEVAAEVQEKKIAIALKRYGYLTPLLDENGNVVKDEHGNIQVDMSKFTPNKLSNRFKELEFNYNSMSKTAQKCLWTTVKIGFWGGLAALAIWVIKAFVIPFLQSVPTV